MLKCRNMQLTDYACHSAPITPTFPTHTHTLTHCPPSPHTHTQKDTHTERHTHTHTHEHTHTFTAPPPPPHTHTDTHTHTHTHAHTISLEEAKSLKTNQSLCTDETNDCCWMFVVVVFGLVLVFRQKLKQELAF